MDLRIQENCENIDWNQIRDYLKLVGMGYHKPESHQKAFLNSFSVVFIFDREKLIGFGRSISDGAYQAAVYDVVVLPEYQQQGIGRLIMERILRTVSNCNIILYANLGREEFYEKQGFCLMKTAMAKFLRPEMMKEKGFIQ
ncbi:MAG: GNAT family N-acetyltransferase [Syntrophales bacterium]